MDASWHVRMVLGLPQGRASCPSPLDSPEKQIQYVHIYIYIYIYICMYVMHINASPYMCTRTCIHAYMHTYIHACMHACIHTQTLSRCLRPLLCVRDLLVELPRRANGLRVMYVGVCVLRVTCVDLLNVWGRRRGFPSISYFWKSPAVPLREPIGDE